jgi:hypothetical protein
MDDDLYNDLVEFLENQQDADCEGDPPRYIPNKAMQLLTRLKECKENVGRVEYRRNGEDWKVVEVMISGWRK